MSDAAPGPADTPEPTPPLTPTPAPASASPSAAASLREFALRTRLGSLLLVGAGVSFWFGAQLVAGVVLAVLYLVQGDAKPADLEAFLTGQAAWLIVVSTLAAVSVVAALHGLRALPARPPAASAGRTAAWVVGLVLACIGGQAAIGWSQRQAGLEFTEQAMLSDGLKQDGWVFLAFSIVVLAPLGEELLFRRLAYGALARPWGRPLAALGTALLFALVHMNLPGLFMYVWLALCCTVAYERCGRSSAPIAVHGLNNLVAAAGLVAA